MTKEKVLTKSPIEDKPLRYPAQSLNEQIDNLIDEKVLYYILAPTIFIMLAINSWIYYFNKTMPHPYYFTILAVLVTIVSGYKIIKFKYSLKALKQGRDGEREVGMNLELLREQGFKVYHDIVDKDFNLDHVLVGTKGIFVIETKTYSKPEKGECKIIYDGNKLSYNGTYRSDEPIIQAISASTWLKNYLKDSTGRDFNVLPIIVFPGWYIESKVALTDFRILNPKGLDKFMQNRKDKLPPEDVALIANRIEIYVKSFDYGK